MNVSECETVWSRRSPDPPVARTTASGSFLDFIVSAVHIQLSIEDVNVGVRLSNVGYQRVPSIYSRDICSKTQNCNRYAHVP